MVLHNDKWKYKAKRAYERKHNIKHEKKRETNESNEDAEKGSSDDEKFLNSKDESDYESGSEEGYREEDNKYAKGKKKSNSWRFENPLIDDSILKDPEYQAELERVKNEEIEKMNSFRGQVLDNVKNKEADIEKEYSRVKLGKKTKQDIEDETKNWRYIESEGEAETGSFKDVNEDTDKKESRIREFTDEEKMEFFRLQDKINHQKKVLEMKEKMNKINTKNTNKTKVLEVKSSKSNNEAVYKALVEKRLNDTRFDNAAVENFDMDDLSKAVYGVQISTDIKQQPPQNIFDLDFIMTDTAQKQPSVERKKNHVKIDLDLDQDDEDFLDSLL